MNIKIDFEELQSMCKYLYIGDHHSRHLCHKYKDWVDCNYNHCPFVMKPCEGEIRIDEEVIAEIKEINIII